MTGVVRDRAAALRGAGVLLLMAGVVLGLLGAGRLERIGAGWRARPLWPLFGAGVGLLGAAAVLLRRYRPEVHDEEVARGGTAALVTRLADGVRALRAGRATGLAEGSGPAALEVLAEAEAPAEEAAYLLWLKVQLDPLLDELLPRLFATREAYRRRHGVLLYARLFSGLSRAERLLLRAWSAAVDGYGAEARAALAEAEAQLAALEEQRHGEGDGAARSAG